MDDAAADGRGDLLREVWRAHPDPLLLSSRGRVIDANPATERTFGWQRGWLLGKSPTVLTPSLPIALGTSLPFRAQRSDGGSFVAAASTVRLTPTDSGPSDVLLTVVRHLTDLVSERQLLAADEMRARERTIDTSRETLTQYLFGAGIVLRSSLPAAASDEERQRIDDALEVLENLMVGLNQDRQASQP